MKITAAGELPLALVAGAAGTACPAMAQAARIENIEASEAQQSLKILVSLDRQPRSAAVSIEDGQLILDIDGLTLAPLAFAPPPGLPVKQVTTTPSGPNSARIMLVGSEVIAPSATLYRNAVLVEATVQPGSVDADPAPAIETPRKVSSPKSEPSGPIDITAAVKVSASACETARALLAKDAWNIQALGDHAVCLARAGKSDEAANRLDQLAAFNPEDPRVAQGRRLLAKPSEKAATSKAVAEAAAPHTSDTPASSIH